MGRVNVLMLLGAVSCLGVSLCWPHSQNEEERCGETVRLRGIRSVFGCLSEEDSGCGEMGALLDSLRERRSAYETKGGPTNNY